MKPKVDAIFELRDAAEEHGKALASLEAEPSPDARDAMLAAREKLEEATVEAIDSCHHCGLPHEAQSCSVTPLSEAPSAKQAEARARERAEAVASDARGTATGKDRGAGD